MKTDILKLIKDNQNNLVKDEYFYPGDMLNLFEIHDYLSDFKEDKLQKKWLHSWICTDTQVGIAVYYFENEIVAVSIQKYRKSDEYIYFVSREMADLVEKHLRSFLPRTNLELVKDIEYDILEGVKDIDHKLHEKINYVQNTDK